VVTLAFALRRSFGWGLVPVYWLAQIAGGLLGAAVLRGLFGTVAHGGANQLHVTVGRGVVLEAVLTMILVFVVLNTATRHRVVGSEAALAVGATIALCGLLAEPLSGASMNPARSLGPVVVGGSWAHAWVYVVGPVAGAVAAVIVSFTVHPGTGPDEKAAAEGDAKE
jgi:aquaporin Z